MARALDGGGVRTGRAQRGSERAGDRRHVEDARVGLRSRLGHPLADAAEEHGIARLQGAATEDDLDLTAGKIHPAHQRGREVDDLVGEPVHQADRHRIAVRRRAEHDGREVEQPRLRDLAAVRSQR
jgi:hypothetical protein